MHALRCFVIGPLQTGRRRLEVERAIEALSKAAQNCRVVADLPKLEAAILNARKVQSGYVFAFVSECTLGRKWLLRLFPVSCGAVVAATMLF